ncbi:hypothetical protein WM00_18925 [Burkholderia cepacia]|nr:hypothetical protein WM00_18925 [Burkholderia cepacia]
MRHCGAIVSRSAIERGCNDATSARTVPARHDDIAACPADGRRSGTRFSFETFALLAGARFAAMAPLRPARPCGMKHGALLAYLYVP